MEKPIPPESCQRVRAPIKKILRLVKDIKVYNNTDTKACVILSPTPIESISSLSIEKIGGVGVTKSGEHKCTKSFISPNSYRKFQLENSQIYYSVLFQECGKWKLHCVDRVVNSVYYNIQLLPRHITESVEIADVPTFL